MTPAPAERPATAWFFAWVVGGIGLILLNCVLADQFHPAARADLTFRPVNPTPEEQARYAFIDTVRHAPWVSFAHALVGVCALCHRGCAVFAWAALMVCLPFLTWLAAGLGNL